MHFRPLGSTGIQVSVVSFGAGPVADLMTSPERRDQQRATVQRAIELGVNWFDTAATYGEGRSEESLGIALEELGAGRNVHIATKVRIPPDEIGDIRGCVLRSVEESLRRLRRPSITLLQVHNSITTQRGDLPTSITPRDVLGPQGMLEAFETLKQQGVVQHFGLTALGDPDALAQVLQTKQFAAVQIPYNILNPSAGRLAPATFQETNFGNLLELCSRLGVGAMAIRVFAGGALLGQDPSRHTLSTKFFPLDLYQRDRAQAARLAQAIPGPLRLPEVALRFVLGHPAITSALIGFGSPEQVEEAVALSEEGALPPDVLRQVEQVLNQAASLS